MMNSVKIRLLLLAMMLVPCGWALPAGAQSAVRSTPDRTRAQLEAQAVAAESAHRSEEAFRIRSRLREGDFEDGDRIIVFYDGIGLQRGDTAVVQTGRLLRLGEPMGDVNLRGVLRSEIADSISGRVGKYFKNVTVHVTPLVRVSITGAVRAPGFYYARADMPVSDVIMRSGGQDQTSDLGNTVIKRGQQVLWTAEDVRTALRDGVTLEGLGILPGDEIVVGVRSTSDVWVKTLQFGVPLLSAVLLQLVIRR
ncbi:MAG: SLBB domain-containing protein [bacterium]